MPIEIEKKFLTCSDEWRRLGKGIPYSQGYIATDKDRSVRVRIAGTEGFLTIKGPEEGGSRLEFEYPIPLEDARELLVRLCRRPTIEKVRYRVPFAGFIWEVDEFKGENTGLVVAEIELASTDQPFPLPPWVGREVTGEPRYYNASLRRWSIARKDRPRASTRRFYTAGTTFDASSRPVYNRLVEFERGTTNVDPRPGRELGVSADGWRYTFKLRPGVKFQTTDFFTPTRDFNADDVIFTFMRQWKKIIRGTQYSAGILLGILQRHGHAGPAQGDRQGRRLHGQVRAQPPGGADPRQHGDGLRLDHVEAEYADKLEADGKKEQDQPAAGRHRPLPVRRLPEGRRHPLQGAHPTTGTASSRSTTCLRHHHRCLGAHAEAEGRRMPRGALSEPGRHRQPEGPTGTSWSWSRKA
jgi:adenylate cyclase